MNGAPADTAEAAKKQADIPERLDKILARAGFGSRSDVKKLIRAGAVTCNGEAAKTADQKYNAGIDAILVNGAAIKYQKHIYLMMNKPKGYVSSTDDPRHKTVADLVPERFQSRRPFPAGRLDIDTTGFLLMTDDGDLAHRMLSPKKHVEKEYEAVLDIMPDTGVADDFLSGVVLDGGVRLKPARLTIVSGINSDAPHAVGSPGSTGADAPHVAKLSDAAVVRVIITEGQYHQIKRMFAAHGIKVLELKRLRIGSLPLDPSLAPGESRELNETEVEKLLK